MVTWDIRSSLTVDVWAELLFVLFLSVPFDLNHDSHKSRPNGQSDIDPFTEQQSR